jgi:hypothetical protein
MDESVRRAEESSRPVSPTIWLRVASILTLIHAVLHTVGGVFGKPKHGSEEVALQETMKAHQFLVMGSQRTYWDFFFGYGLILGVCLFVQGVLFWQLGEIAKSQPKLIRPILVTFILSFLATTLIAGRYFFIAPVVTEAIIAACLLGAYLKAGRTQAA